MRTLRSVRLSSQPADNPTEGFTLTRFKVSSSSSLINATQPRGNCVISDHLIHWNRLLTSADKIISAILLVASRAVSRPGPIML